MYHIVFKRCLSVLILVAFVTTGVVPPSFGQSVLSLPQPGTMVLTTPAFDPAILKGMKVNPDDPLQFEFILDKGDQIDVTTQGALIQTPEAERLIRYFLAALTVPEKDLWVNLSPYEKDRIITDEFGQTEMGRDLLSQDYILKQITSSLMYPDGESGKKFWKDIYVMLYDTYGTTDVPMDTFNKVWITPDKAVVYEDKNVAYISESHLKVMLESDYLATSNNPMLARGLVAPQDNVDSATEPSVMAKDLIRKTIVPLIEREVNEGRNFAQLRQVYQSLILAAWYKRKIKDSLLSSVYVDQNKVKGVTIDDPQEAVKIWDRYVEAFKKGAFNYIKEEQDEYTQELIPRKYFSGGFDGMKIDAALDTRQMQELSGRDFAESHNNTLIMVDLKPFNETSNVFVSASMALQKDDNAQTIEEMGQKAAEGDVAAIDWLKKSSITDFEVVGRSLKARSLGLDLLIKAAMVNNHARKTLEEELLIPYTGDWSIGFGEIGTIGLIGPYIVASMIESIKEGQELSVPLFESLVYGLLKDRIQGKDRKELILNLFEAEQDAGFKHGAVLTPIICGISKRLLASGALRHEEETARLVGQFLLFSRRIYLGTRDQIISMGQDFREILFLETVSNEFKRDIIKRFWSGSRESGYQSAKQTLKDLLGNQSLLPVSFKEMILNEILPDEIKYFADVLEEIFFYSKSEVLQASVVKVMGQRADTFSDAEHIERLAQSALLTEHDAHLLVAELKQALARGIRPPFSYDSDSLDPRLDDIQDVLLGLMQRFPTFKADLAPLILMNMWGNGDQRLKATKLILSLTTGSVPELNAIIKLVKDYDHSRQEPWSSMNAEVFGLLEGEMKLLGLAMLEHDDTRRMALFMLDKPSLMLSIEEFRKIFEGGFSLWPGHDQQFFIDFLRNAFLMGNDKELAEFVLRFVRSKGEQKVFFDVWEENVTTFIPKLDVILRVFNPDLEPYTAELGQVFSKFNLTGRAMDPSDPSLVDNRVWKTTGIPRPLLYGNFNETILAAKGDRKDFLLNILRNKDMRAFHEAAFSSFADWFLKMEDKERQRAVLFSLNKEEILLLEDEIIRGMISPSLGEAPSRTFLVKFMRELAGEYQGLNEWRGYSFQEAMDRVDSWSADEQRQNNLRDLRQLLKTSKSRKNKLALSEEGVLSVGIDILLSGVPKYIYTLESLLEAPVLASGSYQEMRDVLVNSDIALEVRMSLAADYLEIISIEEMLFQDNDGSTKRADFLGMLTEVKGNVNGEIVLMADQSDAKRRKIQKGTDVHFNRLRHGFLEYILGHDLSSEQSALLHDAGVFKQVMTVLSIAATKSTPDFNEWGLLRNVVKHALEALFANSANKGESSREAAVESMTRVLMGWDSADIKAMRGDEVMQESNKSVIEKLIAAKYAPDLWTLGVDKKINLSSVSSIFEKRNRIVQSAYEMVEIAQGLGVNIMTLSDAQKHLNSLGRVREFYDQFQAELKDRTINVPQEMKDRMEYILNQVAQIEEERVEASADQEYRVTFRKDFLNEVTAGVGRGIPGCFHPKGIHREMPVIHALEANAGFLQIYAKDGVQVGNAVVILTEEGAYVYTGYVGGGFNSTLAFAQGIMELSRYVPKIYLSESSAGYEILKNYGEKMPGSVDLYKPATIFEDQYFDHGGNRDNRGMSIKLMAPLAVTFDMLTTKGAFEELSAPQKAEQEKVDKKQIDFKLFTKMMLDKGYKKFFPLVGALQESVKDKDKLVVDDNFYSWVRTVAVERNIKNLDENEVDQFTDLFLDFLEEQLFALEVYTAHGDPAEDVIDGGIDLNRVGNELRVNSRGEGIRFNIDPAQLEAYKSASGFVPVITRMQSIDDLPAFLGIPAVVN